MSEEADMEEVVETTPVEEPEAVVEEPEAVEEAVVVVPKKKRKRSEAQINALASARKSKLSKLSKMSKKPKKPVKIERQYAESPSAEFSWTKEICKASILASLGLASIYVQQKCAQTVPPPEVVQVEEKQVPKKKPCVKTGGGKDPFAGYR
jgi:hypothetical protein